MKRSFHGKKSLCGFLVTALLAMAVLGGCADGTGESSEDNSSKESTAESTQPDSTESDGSEEADASGDSKETEGSTETGSESESASGQAGDMYGGSIVVGVQQDIDSLDPHKATAAGTKEIIFNIFEGLVKPDENGNLINAVASDYTISEDGLVYTFTLRENVKFHNGNVVTAEDVKYSLERVSGLLDGTPLSSTLNAIESVDIIDEKTVQVTVENANTELIYSFVAAIIPAGSGEDAGADPIGTGPFSFVSYKPQEGIVLAKNPDYWQEGLPYLDQVEFKIINSADTALLELQGGTIDFYAYLTDSQAQALQGSHQVISSPTNRVQALFLNNAVEPLNDVLTTPKESFNGVLEQLTDEGGKFYGIPFRSDFWVVFYNKDLFDAAGVAYPTNDMTLDDYDALMRQMTSGSGAVKVYGGHYHTWRSAVSLFGILDGKQTIVDGTYDFLKPIYERVLKQQADGVVMDYGELKTATCTTPPPSRTAPPLWSIWAAGSWPPCSSTMPTPPAKAMSLSTSAW